MSQVVEQAKQVLAAEYVLGTLSGKSREGFERRLSKDRQLQLEVTWWESNLGELGMALEPVAPKKHVWDQLESRLGWQKEESVSFWRKLCLWQLTTVFASGLAIALAVGVYWQDLLQPEAYSQITHADTGASWSVLYEADQKRIEIKTSSPYPLEASHDLELWLLVDGGPVSLGLLPRKGELERVMERDLPLDAKLAVSLEPRGGSPLETPTGPVLSVADIQRI